MIKYDNISILTEHFSALNRPHLTLSDIQPALEELSTYANIELNVIGHSFQQRPIHLLKLGCGPKKILAWTQMHGDEPTASAAICDLLYLLCKDHFGSLDFLCDSVSLYVVPMLNPDGAEQCTRTNAQGIDINRDANKRASPEGRLLFQLVEEIRPDIALNLHDQSCYYGVEGSNKNATLALLAPPFDDANSIDDARHYAMRLIGRMAQSCEPYIGGRIARYDDEYTSRCFGDSIAHMGISTILIESGHAVSDANRQVARAMNVIAINSLIEAVLTPSISLPDIHEYQRIPQNIENAFADILLRDVWIQINDQESPFKSDIMFRQKPGELAEIGDLDAKHGFIDLTQPNWHIRTGRPFFLHEPLHLTDKRYLKLLQSGFSYFVGQQDFLIIDTGLPYLCCPTPTHTLRPGGRDFAVVHKDDQVIAAILNSQWIDTL